MTKLSRITPPALKPGVRKTLSVIAASLVAVVASQFVIVAPIASKVADRSEERLCKLIWNGANRETVESSDPGCLTHLKFPE